MINLTLLIQGRKIGSVFFVVYEVGFYSVDNLKIRVFFPDALNGVGISWCYAVAE